MCLVECIRAIWQIFPLYFTDILFRDWHLEPLSRRRRVWCVRVMSIW